MGDSHCTSAGCLQTLPFWVTLKRNKYTSRCWLVCFKPGCILIKAVHDAEARSVLPTEVFHTVLRAAREAQIAAGAPKPEQVRPYDRIAIHWPYSELQYQQVRCVQGRCSRLQCFFLRRRKARIRLRWNMSQLRANMRTFSTQMQI